MGGNNTGLAYGHGEFPSPWRDLASRYTPRTMKDSLWLCEYLYLNYGVYRAASERIVDYFLTKPKFTGQSDEERKKFEKIMNKDFGIVERLREIGHDYMCYGNAFCSIHLPFRRVLRCQSGCKNERNLTDIKHFKFNIQDLSFDAYCPKCRRITRQKFHDYPSRDPKKIHMIRWNPKNIRIQELFTGDMEYWLEIPGDIQSKVRSGDQFVLQYMPKAFLSAIQKGQKFKFDPRYFHHMRESTLSGLNLMGWGIPTVLSAFRNFFRLQVLHRYDEVLKMDYILPMRIISPSVTQIPVGNEMMQIGQQNFMMNAANAVRRHRMDGADWSFFPFPVNYQAIGSEGAQLEQGTRDSITAEEDRLLNTRGIPPELYRGSLTIQAAPVALRLFERGHTPLVMGFNRIVQWVSDTISRYLNSGEYEGELEPVTIADNIEDKQWRLQAAMGQLISKETGFGGLGIDPKTETKKIIEEQLDQQEQQQTAQQDAQMKQMTLDAPAGGEGGGQQQGGMTPMDVEQQGEETARQLLDPQVPEATRRQQLSSLRGTNPTLHAVVIKKMDQLRNQAGTLGQAAGMQQMGIGAPAQ